MLEMVSYARDLSERRDPGCEILIGRISKRIEGLKSGSK